MADMLSTSLQESVLTLLAVGGKEGKIASRLLDVKSFDDSYRDVAKRILAYRKEQGKAPGLEHLDDVLDDLLHKRNKKHRQYMRIAEGIVHQADGLNAPYILSRVNEFSRRQNLKAAMLEANEIYQAGQPDLLENIEAVLTKALKPQVQQLEVGVRLSNKRILNFLDSVHADYLTGIEALDERDLGPTRKELLLLLGAKGIGKSWWCCDNGIKCLMQGAKVLHVTLEMDEARTTLRYLQAMFGVGKRRESYKVTKLQFDDLDRITGWKRLKRKVRHSMKERSTRRFLRDKLQSWGTRLENLIIKEFPSGSLTIGQLEAYMDMLELHEGFIPDVLILDYPDLMKLDVKDLRGSLGRVFVDLRGLGQKRNLAVIAPTQTNRKGWDAGTVKASMVAEDASKFRTADKVLIYSQTAFEKALGLARLYVDKNRDDEDGYSIVITQDYRRGKWILDGARMHKSYMDLIRPDNDNEEEDEDDAREAA